MSCPVSWCTPPLCTYCICFRFDERTRVVFVVLYQEEKKQSGFVYGHSSTSVILFSSVDFGFIVLFSLYENTLNFKWKLLQGIAFAPTFIPLFLVVTPGVVFWGRGGRIVNAEL